MSRIRAAAEMMKNLPGRGQDISKQVLGNPGRRQTNLDALLRGQPGNLSLPGSYATRDLSKGAALGLTTGMGLGGGLGMSDLTEGFTESAKLENSIFANPEELGRQAARAKMSLEELMDKARQEAERIGQIPQIYFLQIQGGYQDEMNRQQEQEPKQIYDEDIEGGARPVSLFMAGGGEASFPDLTGDGQVTQADILKGRGVYATGGEAIGDELEGMEMSEEQAMAEVGVAEKEMQMIQQLVTVVQKLIAEGISEKDLIAFLKEQGLDDEDIDGLMQMVLQSQGSQDPEGIDQQIAGMM